MSNSEEFRRWARNALNGRWLEAILAGIVIGFLGSGPSLLSTPIRINLDMSSNTIAEEQTGILMILGMLTLIWVVVLFVIGGALQLGYCLFNLNLVDGKPAQVSNLFSQFHRIGTGICMNFFLVLFEFLWSLLFIIPGIIAAYSYAMTPYILAEHPEYGALEAIRMSKEMMRGNKMRLFILNLSFIGWILLSILTCGLGMLAVTPYMQAANAAFYREVSAQTFPA